MKTGYPIIYKPANMTEQASVPTGQLLVPVGSTEVAVKLSSGTASTLSGGASGGSSLRAWAAGITVESGEILRASVASGTIGIGDFMSSNSTRTTGTTFNATEAAFWTELPNDPDIPEVVDNLVSTDMTKSLSANQGRVIDTQIASMLGSNLILNGAGASTDDWDIVEGSTGTFTAETSNGGEFKLVGGTANTSRGYKKIAVEENVSYLMRVKVRATAARTTGLYVRFNERNSDTTDTHITVSNRTSYIDFIANGPVSNVYEEKVYVYTPTRGTKWATFGVYHWWTNGEDLFFDNVEMEKIMASDFSKYTLGHPVFTANPTEGHTVTQSSAFSTNHQGWRAFQTRDVTGSNNEWATSSVATGTMTIELPTKQIFTKVSLKGRGAGLTVPTEYPSRWKIESSNDNSTWTTLLDNTAADVNLNSSTPKDYTFINTTMYKYYRFNMTASVGTNPGLNYIRYYNEGQNYLGDHIHSTGDIVGWDTQDHKMSVRVATVAALPANSVSSGVMTATANGVITAQDGITLALDNRILVKNEATGANNGIYTVTSLGTATTKFVLTRATDADGTNELNPGSLVYVEEGTSRAYWILTNTGTVIIGTTALTFEKIPSNTEVTSKLPTTTIGGGTDLNNLIVMGAYRSDGNGSPVNAPSGITYGRWTMYVSEVTNTSITTVHQTIYFQPASTGNHQVWHRNRYDNTTWDSWMKIATTADTGYKKSTVHVADTNVAITEILHINTEIHLEGTGDLTIAPADITSDTFGCRIINTGTVANTLTPNALFDGSFIRNGDDTDSFTVLTINPDDAYDISVTNNGGFKYLNVIRLTGFSVVGHTHVPQASTAYSYSNTGTTQTSETVVNLVDAVVQPTATTTATTATSSAFTSNIGGSHTASVWFENSLTGTESATDLVTKTLSASFDGSISVSHKDNRGLYSRKSVPAIYGFVDKVGVTAQCALSMRKVIASYTGACLKLRRSSDSAERDLRFNALGLIDLTETYTVGTSTALGQTASAFVGSSDGTVVIWYDQSGNGRNGIQNASVTMPRLYVAGVLQTINSKAGVAFEPTMDMWINGLPAIISTGRSVLSRQQLYGATKARTITSPQGNCLYFTYVGQQSSATTGIMHWNGTPSVLSAEAATTAVFNYGANHSTTALKIYRNGTGSTNAATNPNVLNADKLSLNGTYFNAGSEQSGERSHVVYAEVIILGSTLTDAQHTSWSTSAGARL